MNPLDRLFERYWIVRVLFVAGLAALTLWLMHPAGPIARLLGR